MAAPAKKEEAPAKEETVSGGSIIKVTDDADFTAKFKACGGKNVIIDFSASWCGPCKAMHPILEKLAKELTDIIFIEVDVDECGDTSSEYGIQAMPTFMFMKDGKKVDETKGSTSEAGFREAIKKAFG
mmetsp:Transcript_2933/g.5452  ORF Transcript_2933/g.5452 Transcript_2933/m.5452 type:complete len:128 (-) Transcript_2933:190-573(-)|eukprot:CAMPEP_0202705332 /NCGR_PEP_ID=MMETSP1385-20130828/17895_1 /ASSEMBLY_ACC=CAM_ASM_000861 /TAXON_ID=933848 /ORGANISM="Elphidium margaritaceum" /LENGTH=127 /DNA_ID=CAMNT_0049363541 /DNA_START=51 /DNA_END=434 /DNA_ORIENTATION=+